MNPTVGRIVHYYDQNQGPFAAVITNVQYKDASHDEPTGLVNLYVFPVRVRFEDIPGFVPWDVVQNEVPQEGARRWEWPPRE